MRRDRSPPVRSGGCPCPLASGRGSSRHPDRARVHIAVRRLSSRRAQSSTETRTVRSDRNVRPENRRANRRHRNRRLRGFAVWLQRLQSASCPKPEDGRNAPPASPTECRCRSPAPARGDSVVATGLRLWLGTSAVRIRRCESPRDRYWLDTWPRNTKARYCVLPGSYRQLASFSKTLSKFRGYARRMTWTQHLNRLAN